MADLATAFSGRPVLITGGLGFIGSNLARRLAALGAQVTIVDSLIPAYGGDLFNIAGIEDRVRVNIADVRDVYGMNYLVQGHEVIFNLAGQVSHLDSMRDPYTDLEINCRSQISILEACREHNAGVKIVYASTRQIYGRPRYLPVDEQHPLEPTDINGVHKLAGEWYYLIYHRVYGLRTVSLRMTNTYGPRMRVKDARQTFIGWWVHQMVSGEELEIFGTGKQLRDLNYVDDVVEALLLAAASPDAEGQVYNLGGDEPISLIDLAKLLVDLNGTGSYRLVPFPPERKRIDIGDFYGDYRKIRDQLGWQPRVSLREGLARTLAFYHQHKEHYW
ncbi:MAG: NAD-dependent epimerase/dehydratase family protein [Anaerolineae bacterium]|nr:NAD-dependent epimerase/dehydratase family protein [Anaerolineae bacterium]